MDPQSDSPVVAAAVGSYHLDTYYFPPADAADHAAPGYSCAHGHPALLFGGTSAMVCSSADAEACVAAGTSGPQSAAPSAAPVSPTAQFAG